MKETLYFAPKNTGEALKLLGQYGRKATVLAGGTDLVPRINCYEFKPQVLLYIGGLGLDTIREKAGKLVIGAATPMSRIAASKVVICKAGALAEAAARAGTAAVRSVATIGGNLAHASPAADLATPLLAMDAELLLLKGKGKRVVALKDFFKGAGRTALQPGEMIGEVSVPVPKGSTVFLKLGRRKAMSLSVVNVAVALEMQGGKCREARIALGSVAPKPLRCPRAEEMLRGQEIDPALIARCASEAMAASKPVDERRATAWYRLEAGTALVARALTQAAGGQGGGKS
jgi:carbon-monoxide dehydrogenase medium subunit